MSRRTVPGLRARPGSPIRTCRLRARTGASRCDVGVAARARPAGSRGTRPARPGRPESGRRRAARPRSRASVALPTPPGPPKQQRVVARGWRPSPGPPRVAPGGRGSGTGPRAGQPDMAVARAVEAGVQASSAFFRVVRALRRGSRMAGRARRRRRRPRPSTATASSSTSRSSSIWSASPASPGAAARRPRLPDAAVASPLWRRRPWSGRPALRGRSLGVAVRRQPRALCAAAGHLRVEVRPAAGLRRGCRLGNRSPGHRARVAPTMAAGRLRRLGELRPKHRLELLGDLAQGSLDVPRGADRALADPVDRVARRARLRSPRYGRRRGRRRRRDRGHRRPGSG